MILPTSEDPDLLAYRLVNLTGKEVVVCREGKPNLTLECRGAPLWQNRSTLLPGDAAHGLCGLPLLRFRMDLVGGLPPPDPKFHPVTYPAYYLVDPFSAMALRANRIDRRDVVIMVGYEDEGDRFLVRSVGILPPFAP